MITLKTLPLATAQEVFTQVATHLLIQMRKSSNGSGCFYRHYADKCAAGCLIADDEYLPTMDKSVDGDEEQNADNTTWDALIVRKLVPDTHADLILNLQGIHDMREPEEWGAQLSAYAEKHGFDMPSILAK